VAAPLPEEIHRALGLTDDEAAEIDRILGRPANHLELAMFSVMWSEHCSYKSSRIHLKRLPTEGEHVLVGPGEGAGVVDVGDGIAAAIRIESHNHPSAIEPYQGAATGAGGILRDIFSVGARPIALMDPLRVGSLDEPRNRWLLDGIVSGISGYGNSVGVPTVGGEVVCDDTYAENPLVNVLCLGLLPVDRLVLAKASGEGNLAVLLGSSTGRDGIGGAAMASEGFSEDDDAKRPAVQVGDPFEEKRLIEACLTILDAGLAVGVQDLGAAGITGATSETAGKGGVGMDVDVSAVPRRAPGMEPWEVMISESQERMLAIVTPDDLDEVLEVCRRWEVQATVIGKVTGTGRLRVVDGFGGEVLADMPAEALGDGPLYDRPLAEPAPRPLAERNLDSESLAASLLHTSADLYEPTGHLYGVQRSSGAPIVLDRFARDGSHAIVLGKTGTGKTMFTGAEMGRCFLRGVRVLAVDPLGDYRRLAAELGGTYLDLGASGVGLNPFALTAGNPGTFAAKLAMLTRLVAAMAGGLTRDESPALDRALRTSYEAAGIGPDPASFGRRAPRLADLAARLADEPGGASLARRLERWAIGSLADVLGGETTVPLDRRVLIVGLAAIRDPEVRAVAEYVALSVLWDAVRRDLAPKLVVIDEAWKVMRQPTGAAFIEELARSARHYHTALQLTTQDIVEFLRSDYGEAVVKQCDIRVLLGMTPEAADALRRYFDLTPAERRALLHARPGEGLLFVGDSHAAFQSVVSDREYAMLTTRPSDLAKPAQVPAADSS